MRAVSRMRENYCFERFTPYPNASMQSNIIVKHSKTHVCSALTGYFAVNKFQIINRNVLKDFQLNQVKLDGSVEQEPFNILESFSQLSFIDR